MDRPNLGQYIALQPRFFSNHLGYRICRETAALNLNVLQNALSYSEKGVELVNK